jgi:hypothetical protein
VVVGRYGRFGLPVLPWTTLFTVSKLLEPVWHDGVSAGSGVVLVTHAVFGSVPFEPLIWIWIW